MAGLPAGRAAGPALRLSRARPVGSVVRASRCNPAKLLLDPYARAVAGEVALGPGGLRSRGRMTRTSRTAATRRRTCRARCWSPRTSTGAMTAPPGRAMADSIFYEVHVKGFTMLHPDVPEKLRGTYAGMAHPAAVKHLQRLGVTAVELLPVHEFVHDAQLVAARAAQLLGLSVDRLLRAAQRLRVSGGRRRPGRRVPAHGPRAARRRA